MVIPTKIEKDAIKQTTNITYRNTSPHTDKNERMSHILDNWIKIERYSIEKYGHLVSQTTNQHVKALFKRLSSAGERHTKILGIIKETLTETGGIDQSVNISSHVTIPEDTKSHRYPTDVETTYHTMKSHLELEKGLKETYEEIKGKIKNKTAIIMFQALAEDEKNHHEELLTMIKMFENTFSNILKNEF